MTRIAAATIEAKAGKEVGVSGVLPRARSNDAVSEDPLHRNARTVVNKGVDGLMWGPLEILGLGIVQLEEQDERVVAWKFSPKKNGRLLKDPGYLSEGGEKVPRSGRPKTRGGLVVEVSTRVRGSTSGASHSSQLYGRSESSIRCLRYLSTSGRSSNQS